MSSVHSCFFIYLLFVVRLFSHLDIHTRKFCLKAIWYLEEKKQQQQCTTWRRGGFSEKLKKHLLQWLMKTLWQGHCISTKSSQLISGLWAKGLFVSQLFVTWKAFAYRSGIVGILYHSLCNTLSYIWNGKITLFEVLRLKYAGTGQINTSSHGINMVHLSDMLILLWNLGTYPFWIKNK